MSRSCPTCGATYAEGVLFCGQDGHIVIEDQDPDDFDPRVGQQLGGYLVTARVADGAMGRVYEGRHPETKARVAIKVLHEHVARDRTAVERFKREYETAQEMNHAYVVKVLEFGETRDGSYFMTMEFLVGEELSRVTGQTLPAERVLRVVCQVAVALDYAHSFGFIHRDLKPDNVFLCHGDGEGEGDEETVRILDFGSVKLQVEMGAKLTAMGTTLGSPYYMSPEQATGAADVDQRTDVFALGAILYELLTNQIAFEGANVAAILLKIMNEDPAPPTTLGEWPAGVDDVVQRALAKDKEHRFGSAGELAASLLSVFGLAGEAKAWAGKAEGEIAAAILDAAPTAAISYGASLPAPAHGQADTGPRADSPVVTSHQADGPAPMQQRSTADGQHRSTVPALPRRRGAWLGMAAAGVLVVAVLAYLLR